MGKAERNRQQSARERIAAQQAAARRAETRRRFLIAGGAAVAVIVIVVVIIVVSVVNKPSTSSTGGGSTASGGVNGQLLPAAVAKNVNSVPTSALDTVGTGSVLSFNSKPVTPITGTQLTASGKPEMLYIGAEFCPYCAAMRWSMAVALDRFGTLSALHGIHSSSTDTDPNTPTLTFYKSTYTSKYLTFTPVENETRTHAPLQNTTSAQMAIWKKNEPSGELGYPFIDFGNKFTITGPLYDPAVLAGKSWAQVAQALHDPSSPIAQGALGTANFITAAICKMTNDQPGNVCSAKGVTLAAAHLG
jgi:thiol-disulfide isomerase/thioredoxin